MADIGVSSKVRWGFLDHSAETTHVQLHLSPLDDAGDNSAIFDLFSPAGALTVALYAMSKLEPTNIITSIPIAQSAPTVPTDATAQREVAIRFIYADNVTGKKYRFDVPAPVDAIVPTGSDDVNMAAALIVAFKAVFDANAKSELGNAVTLLSGRFVGRRN